MKKILNFVVDLDNTLFYNDIVDRACDRKGVPRSHLHDLTDLPTDVQDECWEGFESKNLMCSLKPFPEVVGIDKVVKDAGHNFIVLSARSHNLYTPTYHMLKKYYPHTDSMMLVESFDKKQAYIDLNADVVVDDHGEHILQALDAQVQYVMMVSNEFTSYNYPYTEKVKELGAEVFEFASCIEPFIQMYDIMLSNN